MKRRDNPEELDSWWGGLGGKDKKKKGKRGGGGGGGGGGGSGGGDSSGGDTDGKSGKLMHVMEIMSSFSLVGVDVPTHRKDCPGCLEALKEKKVHYEVRQTHERSREESCGTILFIYINLPAQGLRKEAATKKEQIIEAARKGEDVSEQIKELYKTKSGGGSSSKGKGKDESSKKGLKAPIDASKALEEFPAMNGSASAAPRQEPDGSQKVRANQSGYQTTRNETSQVSCVGLMQGSAWKDLSKMENAAASSSSATAAAEAAQKVEVDDEISISAE